jgi:hypothetical protein
MLVTNSRPLCKIINMECRGRMGSKFLADAGLPCDNSSTIAAVLRDRIKYTPCIQNTAFRGSAAEM